MSTIRRLFDDPKNAEIRGNRYVQVCCDGNAPYWDTYRIHDDRDAWASRDSERNMPAYKQSDSVLVRDMTGASDNDKTVMEYDINGKTTGSNDKLAGYVRVEGPYSGYKPDFLTPQQWMDWQGVEYTSLTRDTWPGMPWLTHLPYAKRVRIRDDKMRWGKGPGGWAAYGHTFLWCQKCETALESAWSDTLKALPMIARGVAMVVSNIPVFGTAISFVINAAVSLAEGKPIDEATLDAIGGALPGQPTSGMGFRAGVAIAQGKRIDQVAIAALPIPNELKQVIKVAADVVYGIASGQNVTKIAYDEIRKQLSPEAQKAMDVAKRIINGENVPQMVLTAAEQYVVEKVRAEAARLTEDARNKGEAAIAAARSKVESIYNQYAAETGYQIDLMRLPIEHRDAITTGLAAGAMARTETVYMFGTVPEKNVAVNETYLQKGQRIVNEGARYKGKLLSDLITKGPLTVDVENWDALNNRPRIDKMTYKVGLTSWGPNEGPITDAWRRGFLIAIGVCTGMSQKGPGQLAVYQTLAEKGGRSGFDAGQAVAYYRTLHGDLNPDLIATSVNKSDAMSAIASIYAKPPPSTATVKAGIPTNLSPPTPIAPPRTEPLVMDAKVYQQKTADRSRWVDYYKSLT